LGRLSQLAGVVELPLSELFALAERPAFERVRLSDMQQRALLSSPALFACYWKVAVEGLSLVELRHRYGVREGVLQTMLTRLEDLGLIVCLSNDRIRPVHRGLMRWIDEGPLLEALHATWPQDLLAEAQGGGDDTFYRLHELHMRPETADEFRQRLSALLDDFLRRARYEQTTTRAQDRDTCRLLVAVAPRGFVPTIPEM